MAHEAVVDGSSSGSCVPTCGGGGAHDQESVCEIGLNV